MSAESKIVTLQKVRFDDKWVEYWFKEGPINDDACSFHECSKAYMFWEAVRAAELYNRVVSIGCKGLKMQWELMDYNWQPVGFVVKGKLFDRRVTP